MTLARLLACGVLLAGSGAVAAQEYHALLDLRLVHSSGQPSWLNGGAGLLRFDPSQNGLRLGQLSLSLKQDFSETLRLNLDGVAYGDHDRNVADLNEAYLEWRPWPSQHWRTRAKLGAFYPEVSFENVLPGWRSPYTISWSAINSWLGEEIRAIGAEYRVDWLGQRNGSAFNLSGMVGVYGWNDPAGALIADRGWGLHDRQTTLFGRIGRPESEIAISKMFAELDKIPGYYAGLSLAWRDRLDLRVMHYDNLGDRKSKSPSIYEISWQTIFDSVGMQYTPTDHVTLIAQYMTGETWIDPFIPFLWKFDSSFLLASYERGKLRLTARRDWFGMRQTKGMGSNHQSGSAWTLAAIGTLDEHWSVAAESLWVDSTLEYRNEINQPPHAAEHSLQLSVRYALEGVR
jgi:hypothetical protein